MTRNIVVIVLDALRADRVGVYGDRDFTPNINDIASDGATFTNAYSVTNTTDPAMTSLHTGLYPLSHGIVNHGSRVTQREKRQVETVDTLPELLAEDGYHTLKFGRPLGRWHSRGFDIHPEPKSKSLKARVYDDMYQVSDRLVQMASRLYTVVEPVAHTINAMNEYRKRENDNSEPIDKFLEATEEENGFYGLIHLMDTHAPYEPDTVLVDELMERFDYSGRPVEDVISELGEDSITGNKLKNLLKRENEKESLSTARIKARYDATVRETDREVGKLVDKLDERDQLRNTMLIILSDHGESLGEHGIFFDHHGLYDQTIKIPLIIRTPDTDDIEIDELVQIIDVSPTITDYLGIQVNQRADGHSLLPALKRETFPQRKAVFAEEAHTQRRRMIRTMEWKHIHLIEGDTECRYCGIEHAASAELYNLVEDSEEEMNLLQNEGDETNDNQLSRLIRLEDYFLEELDTNRAKSDEEIAYEDEDVIMERLEHLGYK